MKVTATRVNELGEMEYTVVPTVEERNWIAVYENMRRNIPDYDIKSLDEFAEEACNYESDKCRALNRMLHALRSKLGKADVTTVFDGEMCNRFKTISDLTDEQVDKIKDSFIKGTINSVYGASAAKTVHPDEDCVLPGCDRYGGNGTYLRIRKVLGHKGAFDFCMGNVIKLVDRWEKKGDPAQNLEKLRDYSAQALVEWRLLNEKLS